MHLITGAACTDVGALKKEAPELFRRVRRHPPFVQLATWAAARVARSARRPAELMTIGLAPCQSGSPELLGWVDRIQHAQAPVRMNPTHTAHAVDNAVLSLVAIEIGATGAVVGLGGAPGQLWEAIEIALERASTGRAREVLIVAGDHDDARSGKGALGAAALLRAGAASGLRIDAVRRGDALASPPSPHAARGLARLVASAARPSSGEHEVAPEDTDGYAVTLCLGGAA